MTGDGNSLLAGDFTCDATDPASGLQLSGAALAYEFDGSSWQLKQKLQPPEALRTWGGQFGMSVAIAKDGSTAVIYGALYVPSHWPSQGYVYERRDGIWTLRTRLITPPAATESAHGWSMTCSGITDAGERIVCASGTAIGGVPLAGALYVYDRGEGWGSRGAETNNAIRVFAPDAIGSDLLGFTGFDGWPIPAMNGTGSTILAPISPTNIATPGYPDYRIGYTFSGLEPDAKPLATAPDAPTELVATPGNRSASIAFTASADNGSSITNYEYKLGDGSWTALDPADTTTPVSIANLTNSVTYAIRLRAINTAGDGAQSAPVSVTPVQPASTPTPDPAPTPHPTPTPTPSPSNKFVTLPVAATNSVLQSTLVVTDPGTVTQKGTFVSSSGARSASRLTACTGSKKITRAGRYKINCALTAGARSARRRGLIRITLVTSFKPTGGTARSITRTVTLKKAK